MKISDVLALFGMTLGVLVCSNLDLGAIPPPPSDECKPICREAYVGVDCLFNVCYVYTDPTCPFCTGNPTQSTCTGNASGDVCQVTQDNVPYRTTATCDQCDCFIPGGGGIKYSYVEGWDPEMLSQYDLDYRGICVG